MENLIIKVIEENIKKGRYFTYDCEVISKDFSIEDYFDNFAVQIRVHATDKDSSTNFIQINSNNICLKEFTIDKDKLDIAALQENYHKEKLAEIEEALMEKYKVIKTKNMKVGFDKDTGLHYTYYTNGPTE